MFKGTKLKLVAKVGQTMTQNAHLFLVALVKPAHL